MAIRIYWDSFFPNKNKSFIEIYIKRKSRVLIKCKNLSFFLITPIESLFYYSKKKSQVIDNKIK